MAWPCLDSVITVNLEYHSLTDDVSLVEKAVHR